MQVFTAKEYLKIDIANSYGLDKLTWDQRLEWFDANENNLLSKLSEAESPAMYYAGVKAWEDVQAGRPTGYAISLDATSSGIQILAALTGDRSAAALSNVIDSGTRVDAYQALYRAMAERAVTDVKFSRADLKRAIMTAFYGSKAVPEEVFGEGKLLQTFFQTLEEKTPHVWELNKAFLDMWNPEALKYSWVLPDNFNVHIKVMDQVEETVEFMGEYFTTSRKENKPMAEGRSIGANITHSIDGMIVRELMRRCTYDPKQIAMIQSWLAGAESDHQGDDAMVQQLWDLYTMSGYLSARILDFLSPSNLHLVDPQVIHGLIDSMPKKPFPIIPVHDCFRVHPNYGNDLRRQYNLQLALITQSDMLQFLLSQVLNQNVCVNKQDNLFEEALEANYALS